MPPCQLEIHTDLLGRGEREPGSAPSDLTWTLQPGTRLEELDAVIESGHPDLVEGIV